MQQQALGCSNLIDATGPVSTRQAPRLVSQVLAEAVRECLALSRRVRREILRLGQAAEQEGVTPVVQLSRAWGTRPV